MKIGKNTFLCRIVEVVFHYGIKCKNSVAVVAADAVVPKDIPDYEVWEELVDA